MSYKYILKTVRKEVITLAIAMWLTILTVALLKAAGMF